MPTTVNGIGTHYYGKRNRFVTTDTCEHCGGFGQISSYDTTKFFVVLFIPLIPLSKLRIMNECPFCTRHAALKLSEYEQAKADAVGEATAKLKADRESAESNINALQTAAGFQDGKLYEAIANNLPRDLNDDVDTQKVLSAVANYFTDPETALAAIQRVVELEDTLDNRQALAAHYLQLGDPDEASRTLKSDFADDPDVLAGWVQPLCEAYLATGEKLRVKELIAEVEERSPAVFEQKPMAKWKKKTLKKANK